MERLLHYVWQHKLFNDLQLVTDTGEAVDVIDVGMQNIHSGPDFFNAKVKIQGTTWGGNVEIHDRASDWFRHHHDTDEAYNNVVLHICGVIDAVARTKNGRVLPQVQLEIPNYVSENYRELLAIDTYPPCFRIIPKLPPLTIHGWMNALTVERLEDKTKRIAKWLELTGGDWERVYFITLSRNFGFGVNADAFEQWAYALPLQAAGKHRDDLFQIEAIFFGQAGLLDEKRVPQDRQDAYFVKLRQEYVYLSHKFSLTPMDMQRWRFLRLRPQNFPHIRLAQLVDLYHSGRTDFSRLMAAATLEELRQLLKARVTHYWETHYTFGLESSAHTKALQNKSIDLIIINTVAPLLFAYGRHTFDDTRSERAINFLEELHPEDNFITRSWKRTGVEAENAADSQALIQLRYRYCDAKDCLRCRFGSIYLCQRNRTVGKL